MSPQINDAEAARNSATEKILRHFPRPGGAEPAAPVPGAANDGTWRSVYQQFLLATKAMQKVAAAVTDRGAPPLVNHGAKRSAEIVEEAKAELSAEPDADDRWNPNPPSDLFTPEEQNEGEDRFRVIANLGRQQEVLGRALFDAGKVDPIVLNILAAAIEGIPATERTAGLKSNPGLRGTPFANAVIEAGGDAKRAPADFVVGYDAAVLGTTLY